jgi:hypothetical protein
MQAGQASLQKQDVVACTPQRRTTPRVRVCKAVVPQGWDLPHRQKGPKDHENWEGSRLACEWVQPQAGLRDISS